MIETSPSDPVFNGGRLPKSFLKKCLFFSAYLFARFFVKLYDLTCRIEVKGPLTRCLEEGEPVLLTWWHQDMLFNFYYLLRFAKQRKVVTIISQSKDGELAAYLFGKFGMIPVRGSSSRGGGAALTFLVRTVLREKGIGVIVCDGPRPPERVVKPGIVALASKTGYPILKVRSWGRRQYIFKKSWCRLLLVYPFSRVTIWSDPPFYVPPDIDRKGLEKYRFEIEKGLNEMADHSESDS